MTCTQWRVSAGTGFFKKRRTTLPRTHPPWTSISTRSSSGGRTPRLSTRRNEATLASSRLPDKAYPKTTSTCTPLYASTLEMPSESVCKMVEQRFHCANNVQSVPLGSVDQATSTPCQREANSRTSNTPSFPIRTRRFRCVSSPTSCSCALYQILHDIYRHPLKIAP